MGRLRPLPIVLKEGLRGAERRWLRPLLRLVRVPRAARAKARAIPADAEELLVALLMTRRRQAEAEGAPETALPPCDGDLAALVDGLLAVPPPSAATTRTVPHPVARPLRRAA